MKNTEMIIFRRIQEKAERMAMANLPKAPIERETACWDAHCYKYIDTSGKVNYIIPQEEFKKIEWAFHFHQTAYEILYTSNNKLDSKTKSIFEYAFNSSFPKYDILKYLSVISPMWDDRERKKRD